MKLGIFAKTFAAQDALASLSAAKAAGYDAVQFNMACLGLPSMPDEISADLMGQVRQASVATGIEIAALSATYNMIHPDLAMRKTGMVRLEIMMRAAKEMGTHLVTLCTGTRDAQDQWRHHPDNQSPEAWRDLLHEMEKAVRLADQYDVDLGIEPELANVVANAASGARLVHAIASPRVRFVLDPANLFEVATAVERRTIIAHAVDLLGDKIIMAHAKDRDASGHFVAAGKGVIDFAHFVSCLKAVGFDGAMITHGLDESQAPEVAAFLKSTLS